VPLLRTQPVCLQEAAHTHCCGCCTPAHQALDLLLTEWDPTSKAGFDVAAEKSLAAGGLLLGEVAAALEVGG